MENNQISAEDIGQLKGAFMIEFGAGWCGFCQSAQPMIAQALVQYPNVSHIKIEDGKGQRLGRIYAVKLWPTLVFLKDGVEVSRLVRPSDITILTKALSEINFSKA